MTVLQMAPMNAQAAPDAEYVRASCLDACAKRFAWEAASSLSAPVNRVNPSGDGTVYLAAIEGQSKASQWMRSVQQLENLNSRGLQQNVLMYSALGSGQFPSVTQNATRYQRSA